MDQQLTATEVNRILPLSFFFSTSTKYIQIYTYRCIAKVIGRGI